MNFDSPQWLLLSAFLPLLIYIIYHDHKRNQNTLFMKFSKSYGSKLPFSRYFCFILSFLLLVIAAARPAWGTEFVKSPAATSELVIVVDVSYSMLANDLKPTRSKMASDSITKLLPHLRGYRVGLVMFAGDVFERAPLTDDFKAFSLLIERAQDESFLLMPGSNVVNGLEKAKEILNRNRVPHGKSILLVSDGEFDDVNEISSFVSDIDIKVHTAFAAGGSEGRLPNGSIASSQSIQLERIAQESDGSFWQIQDLPGLAVSLQRVQGVYYEDDIEEISKSRSSIFIVAALLIMCFLLVSPSVYARYKYHNMFNSIFLVGLTGTLLGFVSCASPSFDKQIDAANSYYAEGQYSVSLIEYQRISNEAAEVTDWKTGSVLYNLGNNLHRLARYDEAFAVSSSALQFSQDDRVLAGKIRYSLGLHSYRKGDFAGAYKWFSEVLTQDPTDIDAKINLEITLRKLRSTSESNMSSPPEPNGQKANSGLDSSGDSPGTKDVKIAGQPGTKSDESAIKDAGATNGSEDDGLQSGDPLDRNATREILDDVFQETVVSLSEFEALEILDLLAEENRAFNYSYISQEGLIIKQ